MIWGSHLFQGCLNLLKKLNKILIFSPLYYFISEVDPFCEGLS